MALKFPRRIHYLAQTLKEDGTVDVEECAISLPTRAYAWYLCKLLFKVWIGVI